MHSHGINITLPLLLALALPSRTVSFWRRKQPHPENSKEQLLSLVPLQRWRPCCSQRATARDRLQLEPTGKLTSKSLPLPPPITDQTVKLYSTNTANFPISQTGGVALNSYKQVHCSDLELNWLCLVIKNFFVPQPERESFGSWSNGRKYSLLINSISSILVHSDGYYKAVRHMQQSHQVTSLDTVPDTEFIKGRPL